MVTLRIRTGYGRVHSSQETMCPFFLLFFMLFRYLLELLSGWTISCGVLLTFISLLINKSTHTFISAWNYSLLEQKCCGITIINLHNINRLSACFPCKMLFNYVLCWSFMKYFPVYPSVVCSSVILIIII